jgi:hypothetical protein
MTATRTCITCSDPIAEKRLVAVPQARRCVGCQEIFDTATAPVENRGMNRLGGRGVTYGDEPRLFRMASMAGLGTHGLAGAVAGLHGF